MMDRTREELQSVCDRFEFSGAIGAWEPELRIETDYAGFYLHVTVNVWNSDSDEKVQLTHSYPYFYSPTDDQLRDIIRASMRQVVLHELGESMWFEGKRPDYPHFGVHGVIAGDAEAVGQ